jgi:hypothetical protein
MDDKVAAVNHASQKRVDVRRKEALQMLVW